MSVNTESNHNSSNSQDLLISVPQKEEFQSYFTFCGHKRRFPIGENAGGLIVTTFLIIIPSFLYMTINFSLGMSRIDSVEELKGKVNSSTYIVFSVVSIITLILALISFYDVATSIPGYQTGKKITQEEFQKAQPTLTLGKSTIILKRCPTCEIVRDIRTFHCQYCNKCVERHDHHCGYVSNCIGKNNLVKFYIFLYVTFIHISFVEVTSVYSLVTLYAQTTDDMITIFSVFTGILCVFVGFFFVFLLVMIVQHTFQISQNETTNEGIRNKYDASAYNRGCCDNWKDVCCIKDKQDEYYFEV